MMQLKIARELEVNVGHRPVHGGEALKTHRQLKIARELEVNVGHRPVHAGEAIKTHRQLKIARELEVNVGHRPVHGGEAIKPHRKITIIKPTPCCFKAQKHVAPRLNLIKANLSGYNSPLFDKAPTELPVGKRKD